jgi:uncharacterized protein (TIGR02444 family)
MDMRLWDFSLEIYRLPGVAPACLRCQDEAGADVNLILFLLWRAVARYCLAEGEIASLDALVAPWREHIVEPLRAMRRELKSESLDETGAFREQIKTVELEAERIEQEALSRAVADAAQSDLKLAPLDAARANLRAYAAITGRPLPEQAVEDMLKAFEALAEQMIKNVTGVGVSTETLFERT